MTSSSFVLFGSGPGIGVSVAKAFAEKHFDRIVLCSRNQERLKSEQHAVEEAAKQARRQVQVVTYMTDLADHASLSQALHEIGRLGPLGMVYHNAARIKPSEPLSSSVEEVEEDFMTGNLALYIIAEWAIPLLKAGDHSSLSFFVTNSHFPESPMAMFLSLSMSKAAQQNVMMSLDEAFGNSIHFAVIKVAGILAPENKHLNPTHIAAKAVAAWEQERSEWELLTYIQE